MKRLFIIALLLLVAFIAFADGTSEDTPDKKDAVLVSSQQDQYSKVHPVPYFDHSIPRDVYIQIYEVVTTKAYMTYSVIESMTGTTFFHGPSVGYGIPADSSLTNPIRPVYRYRSGTGSSSGVAVEQAEPNGLFSSKNTDGTWVLFVMADGSVAPIYTEHKVTTFPFNVRKTVDGWIRSDSAPVEFTIEVK